MDSKFFWISLAFLISNFVGAITGFGSVVIGLSIAAHFIPLNELVPIVVPIDLISSCYILFKYFNRIDWKTFLKNIIPLVSIGFIVGLNIAPLIEGPILKKAFGGFILFFAIWQLTLQLIATIQGKSKQHKKPNIYQALFFLISGGILQGVYASGGPMIVSYVSKKINDKYAFRSTLMLLWLILNTALIFNFLNTGRIHSKTLMMSGALIPTVILGIFIGDRVHKHVSESHFRIFVFAMLTISGLSLLWS